MREESPSARTPSELPGETSWPVKHGGQLGPLKKWRKSEQEMLWEPNRMHEYLQSQEEPCLLLVHFRVS